MIRQYFAQRDATIYERWPQMNTGIDSILEITKIQSGSYYYGEYQSNTYNTRTLIDFGNHQEIPFIDLFDEMLDFVDDVVEPLGSRKYLDYLRDMVKNGTSSDRQLEIYNKNKNIHDVVDSLISETLDGC